MTSMTTLATPQPPLLELARAAMPELAEVETGLIGIDAALSRIDRDGQPEWEPVDTALADVLAGLPIPDDMGSRVLTVRKANEATGVAVQALTRLRERLHVHQRQIQVKYADRALHVVAADLGDVLTLARPVLARLGSVNSGDAAITSGLVDEWRAARDIGGRYTEVRAVQLRITEDAMNPDNLADRDVALLVLDHGWVRDADQLDDAVGTDPRQPRVDHPQLMLTAAGAPIDTRPWNTGDRLADLHFVCRRDVSPWVPSIAELTSARAEFQARKRDTARTAAGLPTDAEGRSMFETTVYTPRSTHNVRPYVAGDDARRAARLRAGATDARSTDA